MFSRKNRNSVDSPPLNQSPNSPLPRLQQLTLLESQLISILGRRNVAVDDSADIFTRLEELYLSSLQGSPLGLETLEKCLRVVGGCDSPARVRFLYFCAHEMVLKGAAADELEPVLLEAFHSSLALRNKVDLGFKAGLAFCQVSEHAVEVDKILSSLIVALEQELGYRPQRKPKQHPSSSTTNGISHHEATKAIYLGTSAAHKPTPNKTHPHGRAQKLELFKLLFEGFVTGTWRVQSEAKRKYYADCREELRGRLIREYPGRDVEKKLAKIQQRRSAALTQLSTVIHWGRQSSEPIEERSPKESSPSRQTQQMVQTRPNSRSRSTHKQPIRSRSQAASNSMGFQSLKASFHRDPHGSTWNTPTPTITPSAPSRHPSFKLHIRRNSKLKLESRGPSEREADGREEGKSERPEVTRLVFKQSSENIRPPSSKQKGKGQSMAAADVGKGIVLKFDRLHHEKPEVKKKKLRHNFNWDKEKPQKENQLQHVFDLQFLPQIVQEHPLPKDITLDPHQSPIVSPDHSLTHPSASDLNSARLIDQLLKQGVEWIAHQESEPSRPVISNAALSECEMLQPPRHESFSDTKLVSESIMEEQEFSKEASYKIVIKTLEKPEVNVIIGEEVEGYLNRLGEAVVLREVGREQQRIENRRESGMKSRVMKPNRPSKLNVNSRCEVSIEIKQQPHNDSECESVEVTAQLAKIRSQDEVVNESVSEKVKEKTLQEDEGVPLLPTELVEEMEQAVKECCEGVEVEEDRSEPEITVELVKQDEEGLQEVVAEWLADMQTAIAEEIAQQYQAEPLPEIPQDAPASTPSQQQQHSSQSSSKRSLPALPLSRLKCSIKAEQLSLSSQSCSVDDKQLSSQIKSCPSIEQTHLQVHPVPFERTNAHIDPESTDLEPRTQLLAPCGEEREGSHFSCSRFLGSKIDTEKESDCEWRSQMNFMNEIFKTDRIAEDQDANPLHIPLLQIPENRRDSRIHAEQSQLSQNQRSNYRSRTQSQISNKSSKNMRESVSSRSLRREKTNVCLSFSYSDNYEAVTNTSKRFNHWLCPQLKVANSRLLFLMDPQGVQRGQLRREIVVPNFVMVNDDTIREVSAKVEAFLGRFPVKKELNGDEIAQIGKQLETVDLLPDETELPSLMISNKDGEEDEIRCVANLKSLRIVLESTKLFLRVNPIVVHSLSELQSAVTSLSPSKFCIRNGEILPQGFWTFTGQRNIKLREKSESAVSHLIFDVLERFSEKEDFDYCVREQSGVSLTFEGVAPARRAKILKNMDTIIGFCLKTVEGKARLNASNLKQFLTLL